MKIMNFSSIIKALTINLSVAFTLLILSSNSFACDCIGPSGKSAIKKDSVAFRGTVTNIEYLDAKDGKSEPRIRVTFTVSRVWYGDVKKTFVLHTTENSWSCAGYYFSKDKEYLVVGYRNEGEAAKRFEGAKITFGTNPCGATLPIDLAKAAIAELGRGKKPKR